MYYVYFIFSEDERYMKIGITNRLKVRLSMIQNGCPLPLKMGGYIEAENKTIAKTREAELHRKFAGVNSRGEWFSISSDVVSWVYENAIRSDMIGNKRNGRPPKPTAEKFLKDHFSYPPRQREKVAALKKQRRLSQVIQAAIDAA